MKRCLPDLGPGTLVALADAIERRQLGSPWPESLLARHVRGEDVEAVRSALLRLESDGFAARPLALLLRTLAAERASAQRARDRIELVWTGPTADARGMRNTAVVARELFRAAEHRVLVVSYALDDSDKARGLLRPLAERMDAAPELRARLCVNVKRPWGSTASDTALVQDFAARFAGHLWPGARLPEVFYDPRALDDGGPTRACLHAKFVVADGARAFVTSANFTEAAHARNIEAGVLIEDAGVATQLERQIDALITSGHLRRLPV